MRCNSNAVETATGIERALAGPRPQGDKAGSTRTSNVVVNGGKGVEPTNEPLQEFKAKFTATDPAGIAGGDTYLHRGSYDAPDGVLYAAWPATCTKVDATKATSEAQCAYIAPPLDTRPQRAGGHLEARRLGGVGGRQALGGQGMPVGG
ncbi:hypothetical protein [Streptomyces sp. NPDC002205]|uniref:hypothetical protein n=1 Tax=Streptomyces sp. NPDC002205 TaxID=3154411 RepID=UPI00332F5807